MMSLCVNPLVRSYDYVYAIAKSMPLVRTGYVNAAHLVQLSYINRVPPKG